MIEVSDQITTRRIMQEPYLEKEADTKLESHCLKSNARKMLGSQCLHRKCDMFKIFRSIVLVCIFVLIALYFFLGLKKNVNPSLYAGVVLIIVMLLPAVLYTERRIK
jgi:hypothetical protein